MLVFLQTSPEVFWIPIIVKGLQSCCAMHPRIYHWSVILQTFLHDCCKNGCCAFTQEAILSTEPIKTFLLSFSKKCSFACAGCTALYTTINPLHLCRAKNNTILIKLSPSPSSTPCSFSPGTSSWHGTLTVWSRNIIQILWIFILLRFKSSGIRAEMWHFDINLIKMAQCMLRAYTVKELSLLITKLEFMSRMNGGCKIFHECHHVISDWRVSFPNAKTSFVHQSS